MAESMANLNLESSNYSESESEFEEDLRIRKYGELIDSVKTKEDFHNKLTYGEQQIFNYLYDDLPDGNYDDKGKSEEMSESESENEFEPVRLAVLPEFKSPESKIAIFPETPKPTINLISTVTPDIPRPTIRVESVANITLTNRVGKLEDYIIKITNNYTTRIEQLENHIVTLMNKFAELEKPVPTLPTELPIVKEVKEVKETKPVEDKEDKPVKSSKAKSKTRGEYIYKLYDVLEDEPKFIDVFTSIRTLGKHLNVAPGTINRLAEDKKTKLTGKYKIEKEKIK